MSRAEMHATRKLVVFSGGLGIASVLPMLLRLARHRERQHSEAGASQLLLHSLSHLCSLSVAMAYFPS